MPAHQPPFAAPVRLRRRTLFGAAAGGLVALGAAGCGPGDSAGRGSAAPAEVTGVLGDALTMAAAYRATAVAQPALAGRLGALEAEHRTHVSALQAALGRPSNPSAAPSTASSAVPPDPTAALAQLRSAEQAAQQAAAQACVSAPQGYAALLGSIAACRATHVEALS